ncbi:MAG: hypothetical protein IBJ10_09135 [Phycisphaerales bacterium]|nr:hypothetical protein [Phycisphaerales bacterium]
MLRFAYEVDLNALLWRPAPIISLRHIDFEASGIVDLQPLERPPASLPLSNIQVVESEHRNGRCESVQVTLPDQCDRTTPGALTIPANLPPTPGSTLVKPVAYTVDQRRVVSFGGSPSLEIKPGVVHGLLRIDRYTRPMEDEPEDLVTVMFDFLDEAGRPWRYVGLVWAMRFWPPSGAVARVAQRRPGAELTMNALLDGRDDVEFVIDGGERVAVRLKYFSFDVAMHPGADPAAITVHAIMCPVNDHPLAPNSLLGVEYAVPVSDLLWRPATRVSEEDVDPEGADFVDLRPLASREPSLPPSPIRVIE